jgi:peptidoglycan hydrolase-like protein with peptidoglycan-binding domain
MTMTKPKPTESNARAALLGLPANITDEDLAVRVAAYQRAAMLPVTGIIDEATWKALNR